MRDFLITLILSFALIKAIEIFFWLIGKIHDIADKL
jgi:hypothetical protein